MDISVFLGHISPKEMLFSKSPAQSDFKSVHAFISSFSKAKDMKKQYWEEN